MLEYYTVHLEQSSARQRGAVTIAALISGVACVCLAGKTIFFWKVVLSFRSTVVITGTRPAAVWAEPHWAFAKVILVNNVKRYLVNKKRTVDDT